MRRLSREMGEDKVPVYRKRHWVHGIQRDFEFWIS